MPPNTSVTVPAKTAVACKKCEPDTSVLTAPARPIGDGNSHKFEVADNAVRLTSHGLSGDTVVRVFRAITICGETVSVRHPGPCCGGLVLDECNPNATIVHPGQYYITIEGQNADDATVIQEPISENITVTEGTHTMSNTCCQRVVFDFSEQTRILTIADGEKSVTACLGDKLSIIQESTGGYRFQVNDDAAIVIPQPNDGVDGLSAYELAQGDGFTGTVAEWLDSLKGEDGLLEDIPDDTTRTALGGFVDSDKGLSLGQLAGDFLSSGMAPADVLLPAARLVSVTPERVASTLYNSATHGEDATKPIGVRGADGTITGVFKRTGATDAAGPWVNEYLRSISTGVNMGGASGSTIAIPDPAHEGQERVLVFGGGTNYGEARVTGNFSGRYRNTEHRIINGATSEMLVRAVETIYLVADKNAAGALRWRIASNEMRMHSSNDWRENDDGTATLFFRATTVNNAADILNQTPWPVRIVSPARVIVAITDSYTNTGVPIGGSFAGHPTLSNVASHNFAVSNLNHTTTDMAVVYRNSISGASDDFVGNFGVHVEGALLDYTALGGIAGNI